MLVGCQKCRNTALPLILTSRGPYQALILKAWRTEPWYEKLHLAIAGCTNLNETFVTVWFYYHK